MKSLKIAIGSDHAGFAAKKELMDHLTSEGYRVIDFGTHDENPKDYPDYAARVARAVSSGRCDRGILACGSGVGMQIAANKVSGIRAAVCWSTRVAKLASQHNWCNLLCLPSRFVSRANLMKITQTWLATPFERGGRHERRVKKIIKLESKSILPATPTLQIEK